MICNSDQQIRRRNLVTMEASEEVDEAGWFDVGSSEDFGTQQGA